LIEEEKADPNEVNVNGWNSLIFAVMGGNGSEVISFLLTLDLVNVNIKDYTGKSAL
jgi:ankyrin repeat protein